MRGKCFWVCVSPTAPKLSTFFSLYPHRNIQGEILIGLLGSEAQPLGQSLCPCVGLSAGNGSLSESHGCGKDSASEERREGEGRGEAWNRADIDAHIRTTPTALSPGSFSVGKVLLVGSNRSHQASLMCTLLVTPDPPGSRLVLYTHGYSLVYHLVSFASMSLSYIRRSNAL